ncbi:MAG: hypothetical protein QM218_04920, partial [Candidatus Cloacimonadota bacterium]|nr:hypothetical protein [Candidatus Cloacimonadota bacterium]
WMSSVVGSLQEKKVRVSIKTAKNFRIFILHLLEILLVQECEAVKSCQGLSALWESRRQLGIRLFGKVDKGWMIDCWKSPCGRKIFVIFLAT